MRINYNILDRCRQNILFEPYVCKKLYNCLVLPDVSVNSDSITFKAKNNNKDYYRNVIRTEGDKIFFGYGFDNALDLSNYDLIVDGITYSLDSEDIEMIIGSIIIDNANLMSRINSGKNFRLISHNTNFDDFLSFTATDILLVNDVYTSLSSCIEICVGDNSEVLDFLKQDSLSISIQPLDCGFLTKDIKLYIEIYGGNPFIENDRSFYKMVLTDLVYNNTIEKDIYYLHIEPDLDLRRYELSIVDQDGSNITHVNGLSFQEDNLIIDMAAGSINQVDTQAKTVSGQSLSQIFDPLISKGI